MAPIDLSLALDTARKAVRAAADASLRHFRPDVVVEVKPDRSPVTAADKESEAAILAILRANFPDASILAEESGVTAGRPDLRWLVDPLDGTRGFARGGSFWGPLVALEHEGEIVVGAMAMPALGPAATYWAARGMGAFRDGARLRVSRIGDWRDAILSMGELHKLLDEPWGGAVRALTTSAATARCYGDLAGCAMVLDGRAEAFLEAGVQPWDLGPYPVMVRETGGRYEDFSGGADVSKGNCIATNGLVHEHVAAPIRAAMTAR